LELLHLSMAKAMADLKALMLSWFETRGIETAETVGNALFIDSNDQPKAESFWYAFSLRPGMFLGSLSGVALQQFLIGMDRGGDWLGLPVVPKVRDIVKGIEDRSEKAYGSRFGAYRAYEQGAGAQELLAWVGLKKPETSRSAHGE